MMNCDNCGKPINPARDDYAVIHERLGLKNDQPVSFYLHLEDCVDDWIHRKVGDA